MSLKALFIANGVIEATASYIAITKPEKLVQGNKMDKDGRMFARRLGTMLGGFGIVSILLAYRHDSIEHNIFGIGWLVFHTAVSIEKGINQQWSPFIIHIILGAWFSYYLYKSDFKLTDVLPK